MKPENYERVRDIMFTLKDVEREIAACRTTPEYIQFIDKDGRNHRVDLPDETMPAANEFIGNVVFPALIRKQNALLAELDTL